MKKRKENMIFYKLQLLGLYLVLLILLGYFVVYPYFSPENMNITEQVSIPKQVPTSKQLNHLNYLKKHERYSHEQEALRILKTVLVTNSNEGFYVTFKNELEDGSYNDYYDIQMTVKRKNKRHHGGALDQLGQYPYYYFEQVAKYRLNDQKESGFYITNLEENRTYYFNIEATVTHNTEINFETNFVVEKKKFLNKVKTTTNGNNEQYIDFGPKTTAVLLIDYTIGGGGEPSVRVVEESRKLGIPILHYMHEFIQSPGISQRLRPLGQLDIIQYQDTIMFPDTLLYLNRKNIKTVFVMGYGPSVCLLYTRFNSVSFLVDLYPEVNIVVVEEGVDTNDPQSKWAISGFRSYAKTTHVSDILTAYGLDAEKIKEVKEKQLLFKHLTGNEVPGIDNYQKDIHEKTKYIVVGSNFSQIGNHLIQQKVNSIIEKAKNEKIPIVRMNNNEMTLDGKKIKKNILLTMINSKGLVPLITGYLNNQTPFWRAWFPGDFSGRHYHAKVSVDAIFVLDALLAPSAPPFSDFGFTQKDAVSILINRASYYSGSGWVNTESVIRKLSSH